MEIRNRRNLAHGEFFGDHDPKWTQCDLRCEFLLHFMSKLMNLKCVRLLGRHHNNMHKILEVSPNIQTLDISVSREEVPPEEIQNIMKTLSKFRQLNDGGIDHKLLHLIVNECSRFYNYGDFEDIMNITYRQVNTTIIYE